MPIIHRGVRLLYLIVVWLLPLVIGGGIAFEWILRTGNQSGQLGGVLFGGLITFFGYCLLLVIFVP